MRASRLNLRWALLHVALALAAMWMVSCDSADDDSDDDDDGPDDDDLDDDDAGDDDAGDDDDSGPARSFRMAAAPFKFEVTDTSIRSVFDMDGFAGRVDAVSLHMDNFFGVPWDEFAAGAPLPPAWLTVMADIKAQADALGAEIYLALTPVSGMRDSIAAKATDQDGVLVVEENWAPGCYDFDDGPNHEAVHAAYLAYVRWMVEMFAPQYLTVGVEIDLYDANCPDEYDSLQSLMNDAYDQEKALDPGLPIFPTLVADNMWYGPEASDCWPDDRTCLREGLAKIADLKRDRIGISSYPIWVFSALGEIKQDYYSAFAEETGEAIVFGEIGWNNHDVVVPYPTIDDDCQTVCASDDERQIEFMEFLFETANEQGADLLVWWSLRDYLPDHMLSGCPCDSPYPWCVLYEVMASAGLLPAFVMWGSMGVIDYEKAPKAALEPWLEWLNRPVTEK